MLQLPRVVGMFAVQQSAIQACPTRCDKGEAIPLLAKDIVDKISAKQKRDTHLLHGHIVAGSRSTQPEHTAFTHCACSILLSCRKHRPSHLVVH